MDISEGNQSLLAHLINGIKAKLTPKNCLAIDWGPGSFFIHPSLRFDTLLTRKDEPYPAPQYFDFVVTNAPFGLSASPQSGNERKKQPYSLSLMCYALQCLSDNGWILAHIEPFLAYGSRGNDLRELLSTSGCSIAAYFVPKAGFYHLITTIRAPLLLIKRGAVAQEFCVEIESAEQIDNSLDVFFADRATIGTMLSGAWLAPGTFRGPSQYEVSRQIENIESDYKTFRQYRLSELATSVNVGKTGCTFVEQPNTIYIPSIGSLTVVADLSKTTKKHQNYFQVTLDPKIVDCSYLTAFLSTDLGQLSLSALVSDGTIPRISKTTLLDVSVPLPDLSIQKRIVDTLRKLAQIRDAIKGFSNNLSINPISATVSAQKIEQMLEVIGELADADKVVSFARGGESKTVEFKETFSLDVKKKSKEKYIEDSAIKTIAAFLNSDGGTMLVGVNDSGAITGIDPEIALFYKSTDRFLLHVKNLIREHIGEQFYTFIDQRVVLVGPVHVLMIECSASKVPVFIDGKDFFVRTSPATDRLEGAKLLEYVKNHFGG